MKYAFYPGCSLESTARDFDVSTRAVCQALDIELVDIPDWVCCGSTPAHGSNTSLALALPAVNLQKAQELSLPVMTACASCYARLRTSNYRIRESDEEKNRVERIIEKPYDGDVPVHHIVDVLANYVGVDAIGGKVQRKFSGLSIASYYGCLLSRPPDIVAFDDAEHPTSMDRLVVAVGADAIDWPYKTECCGGALSVSNTDVVCRLSHRILAMARRAGADCIVAACPLCQINLDLRQSDAVKKHGDLPATPVLYITQLLGLALGMEPADVALDALSVSAKQLLEKV